jgi:carbonic anhydrase/acetyltransferase-like protein (isoleucine patch superfamily)
MYEAENNREYACTLLSHDNGHFWHLAIHRACLAHDSIVHGPTWIGNNTIVGVKSAILDSKIGNNVVIRLGSMVMGVEIPDNTLVPVGSIITNQTQVANLPSAIGSPSQNLNQGDLLNSRVLAKAYNDAGVEK